MGSSSSRVESDSCELSVGDPRELYVGALTRLRDAAKETGGGAADAVGALKEMSEQIPRLSDLDELGVQIPSLSNSFNFYDLLGVEHTATVAEIEKARRRIWLLVHPDKHPAAEVELANSMGHALTKAFECLKEKSKRADYDDLLAKQVSLDKHQTVGRKMPDTKSTFNPNLSSAPNVSFMCSPGRRKIYIVLEDIYEEAAEILINVVGLSVDSANQLHEFRKVCNLDSPTERIGKIILVLSSPRNCNTAFRVEICGIGLGGEKSNVCRFYRTNNWQVLEYERKVREVLERLKSVVAVHGIHSLTLEGRLMYEQVLLIDKISDFTLHTMQAVRAPECIDLVAALENGRQWGVELEYPGGKSLRNRYIMRACSLVVLVYSMSPILWLPILVALAVLICDFFVFPCRHGALTTRDYDGILSPAQIEAKGGKAPSHHQRSNRPHEPPAPSPSMAQRTVPKNTEKRVCSRCQARKTLDSFSKTQWKSEKHTRACRDCLNAAAELRKEHEAAKVRDQAAKDAAQALNAAQITERNAKRVREARAQKKAAARIAKEEEARNKAKDQTFEKQRKAEETRARVEAKEEQERRAKLKRQQRKQELLEEAAQAQKRELAGLKLAKSQLLKEKLEREERARRQVAENAERIARQKEFDAQEKPRQEREAAAMAVAADRERLEMELRVEKDAKRAEKKQNWKNSATTEPVMKSTSLDSDSDDDEESGLDELFRMLKACNLLQYYKPVLALDCRSHADFARLSLEQLKSIDGMKPFHLKKLLDAQAAFV